jgi:hypothetical protein
MLQTNSDKGLNSPAAVGTKFKILIQRPFAIRTGFILIAGLLRNIRAKFRDRLFTTITHDEWMTFFNSQDRDKKETEVVIHPFKISLVQTAKRAPPGVLVQYLCFGRYAGDEDHTGVSLFHWLRMNLDKMMDILNLSHLSQSPQPPAHRAYAPAGDHRAFLIFLCVLCELCERLNGPSQGHVTKTTSVCK